MAYVNRKIYAFWTNGPESTMTPNRKAGLQTMRDNFGVPVELVTPSGLAGYILSDHPLHEGFKYLCRVHQADYLRCYFMHFYGGGYSDIKFYLPGSNWAECFDVMDSDPRIYVVGKKEIKGGSACRQWKYNEREYSKLLANGWFICRPQTPFTARWYDTMMNTMDALLPRLKAHPADHSTAGGRGGRNYPMWWPQLLCCIVHPLEHDLDWSHKRNCLVVNRENRPYL